MQTGVVAMIDALGFKGIWQRHRPEDVLAALTARREEALRDDEKIQSMLRGNPFIFARSFDVLFLSDTIVVTVVMRDREEWLAQWQKAMPSTVPYTPSQWNGLAVWEAATVLSVLQRRALGGSPPLVYRGCMAFGEFESKDRTFLVGPAVDEAAEGMDLPQGGFVWVTPSAERFLQDLQSQFDLSLPHVVRYSMPLKSGPNYEALCVAPFDDDRDPAVRARLRQQAEGTFSGVRPDILHKKQNTMRFYDHFIRGLEEADRERKARDTATSPWDVAEVLPLASPAATSDTPPVRTHLERPNTVD